MEFRQSSKLNDVCYEIRGPVVDQANALEEEPAPEGKLLLIPRKR